MFHRRFKPLICILAAAQLLLAMPISAAPIASAALPAPHCADMPAPDDRARDNTGPGEHEAPCDCCPDDITTMAGCASVCAAMPAATSTLQMPVARAVTIHAVSLAFLPISAAADPPLDPPPIA